MEEWGGAAVLRRLLLMLLLIFLFLLCVRKLQLDIGSGGGFLNGIGVGCAPFTFGADLTETQCDLMRFVAALRLGTSSKSCSSGRARSTAARAVFPCTTLMLAATAGVIVAPAFVNTSTIGVLPNRLAKSSALRPSAFFRWTSLP